MKRYRICFLFLTTAVLCFLAGGFFYTAKMEKKMQAPPLTSEQEAVKLSQQPVIQNAAKESEQDLQNPQEVIPANQSSPQAVTSEGEYYLVEENGFLLVFCKDKTTLCLHTHMPVTDFPVSEQERLAEGIWFSTMLDVFQYLESYTS